ncbi:hypothetical protein GCM10027610_138510 [Dactylosporangium cerinum]
MHDHVDPVECVGEPFAGEQVGVRVAGLRPAQATHRVTTFLQDGDDVPPERPGRAGDEHCSLHGIPDGSAAGM